MSYESDIDEMGVPRESPRNKENFPWEAIAVIAKVLEANSDKYEPGQWRRYTQEEHIRHANDHLQVLFEGAKQAREKDMGYAFFLEDHLAHALTRLAMAVAVRREP